MENVLKSRAMLIPKCRPVGLGVRSRMMDKAVQSYHKFETTIVASGKETITLKRLLNVLGAFMDRVVPVKEAVKELANIMAQVVDAWRAVVT